VLHTNSETIEALKDALAKERESHTSAMEQLAMLKSTDLGTLQSENVALKEKLAILEKQGLETASLLESLREQAMTRGGSGGGGARKKKRWQAELEIEGEVNMKMEMEQGQFFFDSNGYEEVPAEVFEDDCVILNVNDGRQHYSRCLKNDTWFNLGDTVYASGPDPNEPLVASLVDIVTDSEGVVCGVMQWFYRYSDLISECIAGREERPSELSRTRELWMSTVRDTNAMGTVVGRALVRSISFPSTLSREEIQAYLDENQHHFFTRKRVELVGGVRRVV
jgi:hypothetical protein